eukprot:4235804-Prymnesium_polylepis.2
MDGASSAWGGGGGGGAGGITVGAATKPARRMSSIEKAACQMRTGRAAQLGGERVCRAGREQRVLGQSEPPSGPPLVRSRGPWRGGTEKATMSMWDPLVRIHRALEGRQAQAPTPTERLPLVRTPAAAAHQLE